MTTNLKAPQQLTGDPQEDVKRFLLANGTVPERRLDVAIEFAQSMAEELQKAFSQWQELERALKQLKVAGNN
jgi:hypothetical protein